MIKHFLLISFSNNQKKYFQQLYYFLLKNQHPSHFIHYKNIFIPKKVKLPKAEIRKKVLIHIERKKSILKRPVFYWHILTFLYIKKANWIFQCFYRYLQNNKYDFIGLWNGKKFNQSIVVLIANQLNLGVLYFETGPLPEYSCVDNLGTDFYSSVPRDFNFYNDLGDQYFNNVSYKSSQSIGNDSYLFIPFQVLEDSNIYLHSPWIKSMEQLFNEILVLAKIFPKEKFVLKTHPDCPVMYDQLIIKSQSIDQLSFCNNSNIDDLIENSKAVITINSTVGMQTIIKNKKLIVLGQAIYGIENLVLNVSNREQLIDAIRNLDSWYPAQKIRHNYLNYLKYSYAVTGNAMNNPDENHFSHMMQKISELIGYK